MATGILVPGRRLVTQPQYAASLRNPHYPGACVLGSTPIELRGKQNRTVATLSDSARPCGRVRSVVSVRDESDTYPTSVPLVNDFTIYLYVSFSDAADAFQYLLGLPASGNAQNIGISSFHQSISNHWGLLIGGALVDSGEALPQNQLTAIVVKRDGTTVKLFRNGVLKNTVTNSASVSAVTAIALNSYISSGSFGSGPGTYYALAGVDASAWTDAEVGAFSGNPWSIFKAPARQLWVSLPVGGTAYTQSVSGSLTPAGALTKQTGKSLSGSSTAAGALSRLTSKAIAGSLTGTGQLIKQTAKAFAGSVTGSGALSTMILFTASVAGSITPAGALSKMTQKALAGASTLTGTITKLTSKGLSASITLSGALNKLTTKAFAGSITVTGALAEAYQVVKSLAGSITPTGALATAYIAFVAGVLKMLSLLGVGQ